MNNLQTTATETRTNDKLLGFVNFSICIGTGSDGNPIWAAAGGVGMQLHKNRKVDQTLHRIFINNPEAAQAAFGSNGVKVRYVPADENLHTTNAEFDHNDTILTNSSSEDNQTAAQTSINDDKLLGFVNLSVLIGHDDNGEPVYASTGGVGLQLHKNRKLDVKLHEAFLRNPDACNRIYGSEIIKAHYVPADENLHTTNAEFDHNDTILTNSFTQDNLQPYNHTTIQPYNPLIA